MATPIPEKFILGGKKGREGKNRGRNLPLNGRSMKEKSISASLFQTSMGPKKIKTSQEEVETGALQAGWSHITDEGERKATMGE